VQVIVALSTLLGVDEQPGELDGYGPIPAGLARLLAADPTGTRRRLITDPLGRLVDSGRTRYRPPSDLADYVRAGDRTCQVPHLHPPGLQLRARPRATLGRRRADRRGEPARVVPPGTTTANTTPAGTPGRTTTGRSPGPAPPA
jgi:hypothetical protein